MEYLDDSLTLSTLEERSKSFVFVGMLFNRSFESGEIALGKGVFGRHSESLKVFVTAAGKRLSQNLLYSLSSGGFLFDANARRDGLGNLRQNCALKSLVDVHKVAGHPFPQITQLSRFPLFRSFLQCGSDKKESKQPYGANSDSRNKRPRSFRFYSRSSLKVLEHTENSRQGLFRSRKIRAFVLYLQHSLTYHKMPQFSVS